MSYTVYMHICPNGKKYVGITQRKPERRFGYSGIGYKQNNHFYNAIKKYGWDNIEHKIMSNWHTHEEAEKLEQYLINRFKTNHKKYGYNKTSGGEVGKKLSEETRNKLRVINTTPENINRLRRLAKERIGTKQSDKTINKRIESRKGYQHSQDIIERIRKSNCGKEISEATRKKISDSLSGRELSEEHRKNVVSALYGREVSEATRKKISMSNKGKKRSDDFKEICRQNNLGKKQSTETINKRTLKQEKKIIQLSKNNEIIKMHNSIYKAFESLNKKPTGSITNCCQGKQKTAYGYIWKYAEEQT